MQVVLVMFRSDGERRSFSVVRNMTVIGRREDCDLRIPVGDVSRKHCRLVRTDDGIRIEDLGSSNGTHVNGHRIEESDLNAGDVVGIGPVKFIVQIDGVPAEEDLIAPQDTLAPPVQADESSMMGEAVGHHQTDPESSGLEAVAADEAPLEELQPDELHSAEEPVALDELTEEPAGMEMAVEEPVAEPDAEHTLVEHPLAESEEPLELDEVTTPTEEIEPVDLEAGDSEWDFVVEESNSDRNDGNFEVDLDPSHEQPHGQK